MTSQGKRRAQTRAALLRAAADLFAERGVDGAAVDAIAEAAGRTSGAVYDHFGGKEGLLFALLEGWVDDVAAVIAAEVTTAATVRERMAALWRNAADHPTGGRRWLALEHELWSYASRHDEARRHLARRYQEAWEAIDASSATWSPTGTPAPPGRVGPALVGLLLGLEMMRRVDPGAVTDELAVAALCGVVQGTSEGALT